MIDQTIFCDGINVHATFRSRVNKRVKFALVAANVLLYGLLIWGISQIPANELNTFIFVIFGLPFLLFFTVTRYTLWNLFGTETIIINTKSFSYKHDFGWFGLPLKTYPTSNGIRYGIQDDFMENGKLYVSIYFEFYDENNLPQKLYTTALRTEITSFHKICDFIDDIYRQEEVSGFSLN